MSYDFNVVEKAVTIAGTDTIIPKKKVIVREDSGVPLSIVSNRYQVIKHAELVASFEEALSTIPSFRDYTVTTSLPHDGGQMYRKYIFNKINAEPKVGDVVRLGLELVNSYDGKTNGGYYITALRLACMNGQVIPGEIHHILTKHSKRFNLDKIVDGIKEVLPQFEENVLKWKTWHEVKVNADKFVEMLSKNTSIPEKTQVKMAEQFAKEDQTKFGAFQAMTWVISHDIKPRKEENRRVLQIALERQISPLFY